MSLDVVQEAVGRWAPPPLKDVETVLVGGATDYDSTDVNAGAVEVSCCGLLVTGHEYLHEGGHLEKGWAHGWNCVEATLLFLRREQHWFWDSGFDSIGNGQELDPSSIPQRHVGPRTYGCQEDHVLVLLYRGCKRVCRVIELAVHQVVR